jgi:putative hydrolase
VSADSSPTARDRALAALDRAVYFLDRGLAPAQKVRAFRNARAVVEGLDDGEIEARASAGTLTELAGIGPSTGGVIADGVAGRDSRYLERLDADSACPPTVGAELRERLRGDLHMHTTWSDGGASVRAMAENAMALGHDYVAITDHSPRLTVAHGLSVERLREQLAEIAVLNMELTPFRILTGMEVDILEDGSLDLPDDALAGLDVVVASVHSKLRMEQRQMTRRMVTAVASPHVDVLGHCTGRQIVGTPRPPSAFDAEIVFAACARFDTAVEINCRPERRDPPTDLLEVAMEWGCKFSIDTDAHAPGQMEWQGWGCDTATTHGIDGERIVNTWDADALVNWARSHPTA